MDMNNQIDGLLLLLQVLALPFVAGLGAAFLGRALLRLTPSWRLVLSVSLLLTGFLAGYAALNFQQWSLPPRQALDWLPLLALFAAGVLLPLEWRDASRPAWLLSQLLLVVVSVCLLLPPAITELGMAHIVLYVLMLGTPWLALWHLLERVAVARFGTVALVAAGALLGGAVSLEGSIVIGGCALSLAAVLAGWQAAAWFVPGAPPPARSASGSAVVILGGIALIAVFYAEFAPWLPAALHSIAASSL